jgi:hypothetical protein
MKTISSLLRDFAVHLVGLLVVESAIGLFVSFQLLTIKTAALLAGAVLVLATAIPIIQSFRRAVRRAVPPVRGTYTEAGGLRVTLRQFFNFVFGTMRCTKNGRTYRISALIIFNCLDGRYEFNGDHGVEVGHLNLRVYDGGAVLIGSLTAFDSGDTCIHTGEYKFRRSPRR